MILLLLLLGTAQARIACIGDSITATAHASSSKYYYPTQLQGMLGDQVVNLGVDGRVLQRNTDRSWWITSAYTKLVAETWDKVIIMLGTNDWFIPESDWTPEERAKCDVSTAAELEDCTYANDYKALIQATKASEIYIAIPPPLMGQYSDGAMHFVNTVLPRIVPMIAEIHQVHLIDVYTGMGGRPDWKTAFPSGGCSAHSTYAPCKWYSDQCHPNNQGCTQLASIVHSAITTTTTSTTTSTSAPTTTSTSAPTTTSTSAPTTTSTSAPTSAPTTSTPTSAPTTSAPTTTSTTTSTSAPTREDLSFTSESTETDLSLGYFLIGMGIWYLNTIN